MKFSTRASYALRALSHIVKAQPHGLSIATLSKTEKISAKYLESIFSDLKKAKLVSSSQGAQGGYRLTKKASLISIWSVIEALGESNSAFYCIKNGQKNFCHPHCVCGVKNIDAKLNHAIKQTLSKIKLSALVK